MQLELSITSYQRLSPSVVGVFQINAQDEKVVVGRAAECDWHLPDPNKILSSRHAEIRCELGQFSILDISTNGVFVNDAQSPLGKGRSAAISDGDRLRLGDFEICVKVHASQGMSTPMAAQAEAPRGEPQISSPEANSPEMQDGSGLLAAGLGERMMTDAHVPMPGPSIPGEWSWDKEAVPGERGSQGAGAVNAGVGRAEASKVRANQPAPSDRLEALWDGLGIAAGRVSEQGPEFYRELGALTRTLLDRLLDMIHVRARQKQQLRVAQTLFQRSENNPLKFSATPQDALDSLLLRPHTANLNAQEAVSNAFDDIMSHERALIKGVEAVVADILDQSPGPCEKEGWNLFLHRKNLERIRRQTEWHREAYGDSEKMFRSEVFIEAYEREADENMGNIGS